MTKENTEPTNVDVTFNEVADESINEIKYPNDSSTTPLDAFVKGITGDCAIEAEKLIENKVSKSIAWAITTAIRDFKSTTGLNSEEEHRTSSLMGFVATSMGIFQRLAQMSGDGNDAKFLWHAARKKTSVKHGAGEDIKGGDFGVAVPLECGNYRVIFFQAKNLSDNGKIDVSRASSKKNNDAYNRLLQWVESGSVDDGFGVDSDYQIVKLARTEKEGRSQASQEESSKNWIQYVVWSNDNPFCLPLEYFRIKIQKAMLDEKKLEKKSGNNVESFMRIIEVPEGNKLFLASVLAEGISCASLNWIELSVESAKKVVGEFVELGAEWYIVDDSSGGRATSLINDVLPLHTILGNSDPAEKIQCSFIKGKSNSFKRKN